MYLLTHFSSLVGLAVPAVFDVIFPLAAGTACPATLAGDEIVSLPRNATFATASFEISTDHEDNSPGNVWLDIDEDGFWEWAWNGTGHGAMSKQAVFTDGASNSSFQISSNSSQGQGFILPPSASISSTSLNVSFSPEVGGGLWQFGTITDIEIASVDGDALPEVIVLIQEREAGRR